VRTTKKDIFVAMASKRAAEDSETGASAPKKAKVAVSALLDIGAAAGEDDLNIKVLQVHVLVSYL